MKYLDLTKTKGCFAKELKENEDMIDYMLEDPAVSADQMREAVLDLVSARHVKKLKAYERFVSDINYYNYKQDIADRCERAIYNAMYYVPKDSAYA